MLKGSHSFFKSGRLLTKKDFAGLRFGANKVSSGLIIAYYKERSGGLQSRLGISASKKTGNSVNRNRYKRVIREFFRKSTLRVSGLDILFVVINKSRENLSSTNLLESLHMFEEKCKNLSKKYLTGNNL